MTETAGGDFAAGRNGVCVALSRDGLILVVRTWRYPAVWQPVGGGMLDGEQPMDAVLREVEEETGWALQRESVTFVLACPMDAHPGTLSFFVAAAPDGDPMIDTEEIAEFRWVTAQEACSLEAFPAAYRFFRLLAEP